MLDLILVYVKVTVDVMVSGEEDRQEHIRFFWVNPVGPQEEREEAINHACRECRHFSWTPYLPEHWEVQRTVTNRHYLCKTGDGKIIEVSV